MKSLVKDDSSVVLIFLSTVGYILFADVVREYLGTLGLGLGDRVVIIGIVLLAILIGLNHEGDDG